MNSDANHSVHADVLLLDYYKLIYFVARIDHIRAALLSQVQIMDLSKKVTLLL